MSRKLILGLFILVLSLAAIGCAKTEKQPGTAEPGQKEPPAATKQDDKGDADDKQPKDTRALIEAEIDDLAFKPAEIKAQVNDIVNWENNDSVDHSIVADDGSFESDALTDGEHFEKTFSRPGTYAYHCGIHPSMTGKIIVE